MDAVLADIAARRRQAWLHAGAGYAIATDLPTDSPEGPASTRLSLTTRTGFADMVLRADGRARVHVVGTEGVWRGDRDLSGPAGVEAAVSDLERVLALA